MLKFRMLGTLEVQREGQECTPTAPRVLSTLALLLVRANHVVGIDTLIDELWAENPPRSAATTAQTYIYQLRRLIDQDGTGPASKALLMTAAPGYVLRVAPEQIDVHQFEKLVVEGKGHLDVGEDAQASVCFRSALDLWSGPPLANVCGGRLLGGHRGALSEQYAQALNLRITADLRLGRHHQLIPELRALVAQDPFNEWYHSLLVFALGVVGRRRDALIACREAQATLSEELGLEPSAEMSRIQEGVLRGRPIAPPSETPFALARRTA